MRKRVKAVIGARKDEGGEIVPVYSGKESEPMVGIFFFVDGEIIMDAVPVEKGEPYGDAIQHGGHYEFWEELVPKTPAERKFKARAYDAYPRGRVLLFPANKRYVLYGDNCISTEKYRIILEKFDLDCVKQDGFEIKIEHDLHYKCSMCNKHFLD